VTRPHDLDAQEQAADWAQKDLAEDAYHRLKDHLAEAEAKAWDSLGKYKFQMFGYWAAIWVHLNRIGGFKRPNPWRQLVKFARENARTCA
jgi:hypothetical protein